MGDTLFLGLSTLASLIGWYVVIRTFAWPKLESQPKRSALRALIPIHFIRFIGTGFLITGVVAHELPAGFAQPAAYGDLVSMVLAYLTFATLQWSESERLQQAFAWIFNIIGTFDLLFAFAMGPTLVRHVGDFGATYFVLTVPVPLLLITHLFIFRTLIKRKYSNFAAKVTTAI